MSASGYYTQFKPGDYAVREVIKKTSFPDLSSSLMSDTSNIYELYNRSDRSPSGLIARYVYDAGLKGPVPIGEINFANVTDSQWAQQHSTSSTTGTTRLMQAGHNLPASGVVTIWSFTGSVEVATSVSFTRSGDTLTFTSDPGNTITGDVFHVEGRCEFGELRTKTNGGKWIPGSSSLAYWSNGLFTPWGSTIGYVRLDVTALPTGSNPTWFDYRASIYYNTLSGSDGQFCGFGHTSTGAKQIFACIVREATIYKRSASTTADFGTGSILAGNSATGAPVLSTVYQGYKFARATSTTVSYTAQAVARTLADGGTYGSTASGYNTWALGVNGYPNGFYYTGLAVTGTLNTTLKTLFTTAIQ